MHKIGLKILLGWALFLPITAYSLGLGDIDVKSFLNQPLKAEISIISARPGEIDDLLVGLANREAFSRASLSRPSHLSDLKFKVVKSDDGASAIITVVTQTAVKEPVLNFLVEADWSKGKVFREFTILLDPPYFAQQASKPVANKPKPAITKEAPPAAEEPKSPVKQPEPIVNQTINQTEAVNSDSNNDYVNESAIAEEYSFDVSSVETAPLESESAPLESEEPEENTFQEESITIADGNTLWSVAKTLKNDDVSMSQVMLALQRVNQEAFGQGNINNLKQGSVLRVPSQQDMLDISQRDAYVEVLNQNGLWNDYLTSISHASANTSNTQTDNAQSTSETDAEESNSELSIVTEDEGSSDKAALRSDEAVEQVSTLRKQLLLSEEETESLKVERDELSARVKMLESELDKQAEIENLVAIEDNSLATMEQQLAQANAEEVVESTEMPMNENPSNEMEMSQDEGMVQEGMIEEGMAQEEDMVQDEGPMSPVEEMPVMASEENSMESEATEADIVEDATIIQTPIIVSETGSASGMLDDIIQAVMTNPIVQGAIAGILLIVLLAVKFLKGRKDKKPKEDKGTLIEDALSEDPIDTQSGIIIPNVDDEDETPINVPKMEEDQPVDEFASTVSNVNSLDDDEEDEFSKTAIISADDMSEMAAESDDAEVETDEQDETLDEVDVYLAYSLFDNAEELLKEKLADSPDRADYRAKLLDTYFATNNKDAFADEASSLKDLGAKANKYWPRVQTMGYELDPSNAMFADGEGGDISELAIAKPEMADFDIGAASDEVATSDFDLSLDGDDTNFDLSEDDAETSDSSSDELPDDLGGLDFDLDDETSADTELENDAESFDIEDGLEFNLDDDSLETETVVIDETPSIEDDSLDISIDDDDLDISVDDIDSELDISELNIDSNDESLEVTGTFNALDDETNDEDMPETVTMAAVEADEDSLTMDLPDDDLNIDLSASIDDPDVIDLEESDDTFEATAIVSALDVEDELEISNPDMDFSLDDLDSDSEDVTDISNIEGLMLPDDVDEVATKLDLAKAFHDMGDSEGARNSLEEVLVEGNEEQKAEAKALLDQITE